MSEILDEHVAIIATRSEWARVAFHLMQADPYRRLASDNPETRDCIIDLVAQSTDNPTDIFDAIMVENVDTQLRIESRTPPNFRSVKILRSNSTRRSAWEPRQ